MACKVLRFARIVLKVFLVMAPITPSNCGFSCQQTGPIVIRNIVTSAKGEDFFSQRISLFNKSVAVRPIYDNWCTEMRPDLYCQRRGLGLGIALFRAAAEIGILLERATPSDRGRVLIKIGMPALPPVATA